MLQGGREESDHDRPSWKVTKNQVVTLINNQVRTASRTANNRNQIVPQSNLRPETAFTIIVILSRKILTKVISCLQMFAGVLPPILGLLPRHPWLLESLLLFWRLEPPPS